MLMAMTQTETIDSALNNLDVLETSEILERLLSSQQSAVTAVQKATSSLESAVALSQQVLLEGDGRLIYAGAGASGRLAVQDGAELWPTFGWPHERLMLCMAGGRSALVSSQDGVEDDSESAVKEAVAANLTSKDVVVALAASGQSPWTCAWLEQAALNGALTIGMANNADTPLLKIAQCPIWLDTGPEVLAGSTRMAAGTAQKIALNLFSTALMVRLNRTYGNLMVDMAAVNKKLDIRRVRLLQGVLPHVSDDEAQLAIQEAGGWVKLAALLALGESSEEAVARLATHKGSLRDAIKSLDAK